MPKRRFEHKTAEKREDSRTLFVFFWVIPRRLICICRRFGTLYQFHLQRPLKMEQIECSETSAYINHTPGNHPKENKQQDSRRLQIRSFVIYAVFQVLLQRSYRRREGNNMYTNILLADLTERQTSDGLRRIFEEHFKRSLQ